MILAAQLVLCTLAAYAFARFAFPGRDIAFILVLLQLMIMPDVLIVENYRTMSALGLVDTITAIGLPYMASRLRHLPAAADLQNRAARTRRGGAGRGLPARSRCC